MDIKQINKYRLERQRLIAARRNGNALIAARSAGSNTAKLQKSQDLKTSRSNPKKKVRFISRLFRLLKKRIRKLQTKPKIIKIVLAGVALLIAAVVLGIFVRSNTRSADQPQQQANQNDNQFAPSYNTVLPDGKSISELGGWKRVSPPEDEPIFAFNDVINTVPVSVSQQPLPKSFKKSESQVTELAKNFNANNILEAGDTNIHIGTSIKGPQFVIFTKNNLLILIRSQNKIDDAYWIEYVKKLGLR